MSDATVTVAIILGGLGAALGLANLILHAANWRPPMAKSPTAQKILADLADVQTDVTTLIASAADASGEADLAEVASAVAALKTSLEPAPADPNAAA